MDDYNDKAQRIVALGVGEYREWQGQDHYMIAPLTDKVREHGTAKWFCNDWRVVGALLEMVFTTGVPEWDCNEAALNRVMGLAAANTYRDGSLREAIVDACLEALENDANP